MNRSDLLSALRGSREAVEAVLGNLTEAQLLAPGALGDWSVKDILAHVTAWEVELLTTLGKARRGIKRPGATRWTGEEVEALNARWHAGMKARSLEQVLGDFKGARGQTVRIVEDTRAAEIEGTPAWLHAPLGDYIYSQTAEHELEHLEHLRAFAARQAPGGANGQGGSA
jgi:hypothetical protein